MIRMGKRCATLVEKSSMVLLRGCAVANSSHSDRCDLGQVLRELLDSYLRTGVFEPQNYEGSFTAILLDARQGRVNIFRNLIGNTFTYYCQTKEGVIFGSNLAEVARCKSRRAHVDTEMLPVYFIYRFVPGKNTLFEGIKRLQPGEFLSYEGGRISVQQIQTFAAFAELDKTNEKESVERLETAMAQVTRNHLRLFPKAACLLSGGIDSSYIQVHWNRARKEMGNKGKPASAAVWLDDPRTITDHNYTLSAVAEMKTQHLDVKSDGLSSDQMHTSLSQTGEMPNHVQSFYFSLLAETMATSGISAGLCGEGADGLFGSDLADLLYYANNQKYRLRSSCLRSVAATMASMIGKHNWASVLELSNHISNPSWMRHPLNTAAAFTDWDSVTACFGRDVLARAMEYRRRLLDQYRVADDSIHRQRTLAIGYLGEAVNTAAYWTASFNSHGIDMPCIFLDSRILRIALNIRCDAKFVPGSPKKILKAALNLYLPKTFTNRPKRGFGQPIFKWLARGGRLHNAVDEISDYDFVDRSTLKRAKKKPNWFLYNLLIYDIWHKEFMS